MRALLIGGIGLLLVAIGLFLAFTGFLNKSVHAVPWGLMLSAYIYFSLMTAGSSLINSVYTLFGYKGPEGELRNIVKAGVFFSLASAVPAWTTILLDLTHPEHAYWLILGFQPASRIAWMAMLYGIYGAVLFVELLYVLRYEPMKEVVRSLAAAKLLISLALVVVSLMLYTNLGQVFGVMTSVPGWFGAHMGLLFLVGALYLGAAGQTLFLYPYIKRHAEFFAGFYGRIMLVSTVLLAIALGWIFITASHLQIAWLSYKEVLFGSLALPFWLLQVGLGMAAVVALAAFAMARGYLPALLPASLFGIAAAAFMSYYLIVLPQTALPEVLQGLVRVAEYHVSTDEIMVVAGSSIIWVGLYLFGMALLPLGAEERAKRLFVLK